jgi:hypothetical protein
MRRPAPTALLALLIAGAGAAPAAAQQASCRESRLDTEHYLAAEVAEMADALISADQACAAPSVAAEGEQKTSQRLIVHASDETTRQLRDALQRIDVPRPMLRMAVQVLEIDAATLARITLVEPDTAASATARSQGAGQPQFHVQLTRPEQASPSLRRATARTLSPEELADVLVETGLARRTLRREAAAPSGRAISLSEGGTRVEMRADAITSDRATVQLKADVRPAQSEGAREQTAGEVGERVALDASVVLQSGQSLVATSPLRADSDASGPAILILGTVTVESTAPPADDR